MKQFLAIAFFALALPMAGNAQYTNQITVNAYGGYNFKERVNFDAAHTIVQDGFQWGLGVEYFPAYNASMELKYMRFDTKFPLYGPQGNMVNKGYDDGAQNFIMFGGNWYAGSIGAKALPFFGASLGWGILEGENQTGNAFAWDAKAGVKIRTKSKVSFKLQAYVQSMTRSFGTDYWWAGPGYVYAAPDYATIFQFGLGGAICLDFRR